MKIKIRRATTAGLKDAEGELFEVNGMQFCLVDADGLYFAIHLPTGCNVMSADKDFFEKHEAIDLAKEEIRSKTKSDFDRAVEFISRHYCERYGFTLPVNKPITINNNK